VVNSLRFYIPKQSKEAVILFTSGSEALPKAVSITHQNIIQNIKGALAVLDVEKDDIMLGFLPPFHSF
jgi:long-chain-fatty-acid--[acyl-carrier-protein] ligase